jgi:hypothetical protein
MNEPIDLALLVSGFLIGVGILFMFLFTIHLVIALVVGVWERFNG